MSLHRPRRRATVLLTTLIVLIAIGGMLALSSNTYIGVRNVQATSLARQQASYAAEAAAALVESKLSAISGDSTNLLKAVGQNLGTQWYTTGYNEGVSNPGNSASGLWIGNCLVRWRVEPLKIYSTTISDVDGDGNMTYSDVGSSGAYTDNYQPDPNLLITPTAPPPGTSFENNNPGYFHFRIVTQAYYMGDLGQFAITPQTAAPWDRPEQAKCIAQAQRIVQVQAINLFRYVIFYAANGPTGDIEMFPGANLTITGAVHSNGALYMGGHGTAYLGGDYHDSANSSGKVFIGAKSAATTITGVDGIFRMRKVGNYYYAAQNALPGFKDPNNIPLSGAGGMTGNNNLNGDAPGDTHISLDGVFLDNTNDTRSGLTNFSSYVRDRKNRQAAVVNTLSNIPELAGYPFEPQRVVAQGVPLLWRSAIDRRFTVIPTSATVPLFYTAYPGNLTPTTVPGVPIYATDLLLYDMLDTNGNAVTDVWPYQPSFPTDISMITRPITTGNPIAPATAQTFLPDWVAAKQGPGAATGPSGPEAKGYYLKHSLDGKINSLTGLLETGLTIRERGQQNAAWTWTDSTGTIRPVPALKPKPSDFPVAQQDDFVKAYACYMCSNYAVYLNKDAGGTVLDVTKAFFTPPAGTTVLTGAPATEDTFMNYREADWCQRRNYITPASAPNFMVNTLTIDIGNIQQFLLNTPWNQLDPTSTDTAKAYTRFSGVIYAHRTPRLGQSPTYANAYDPFMPLAYHALAAPLQVTTPPPAFFDGTTALYPVFGSSVLGSVNAAVNAPTRDGDATSGAWSVFPFPKQIRIKNGATINWGGVQPGAGNRNRGLTVISPNHCYVWGDYNITVDSQGKLPPCAVFADGVTALSNRWNDAAAAFGSYQGAASTTYNTSFVINNMPTDSENAADEGSGGTHNVVRFLENWSGSNYTFMGSLVVMNRMRYARGYLGAGRYYSPPNRILKFNSDLLTEAGRPPESPGGTVITRVVSSINITNH